MTIGSAAHKTIKNFWVFFCSRSRMKTEIGQKSNHCQKDTLLHNHVEIILIPSEHVICLLDL